jgi:SP family general alpha glucoside:H+ symporter-like MFS transporter
MFGIWGLQNWCGNAMLGLGVVLLQTAGMSAVLAYDINTVINATNILAVAFGWLLLPHFGRRSLFLTGLISLGGTLVVLGILAFVKQSPANLYTQGAMLVVQSFWFQANINPLSYAIAGEIPATHLRPQAIAMGRAFYVVTTVPLNQLLPYMLNQKPAGWGWGTKSAWFWLGCNILCTLWVYFRLPETGGFSFAELDILFSNKVSARKFKHVTIHDELAEAETKAEITNATNEKTDNEKDVVQAEVYQLNA